MTTTIRHPDGTIGTYTITNPATWAALQSLKPMKKSRIKACKRTYPKFVGLMSTSDYVRAYWRLNFVNGADPSAFFQPLPDTPAAWAPDTVEIETVED
jgi:hypothetical protein